MLFTFRLVFSLHQDTNYLLGLHATEGSQTEPTNRRRFHSICICIIWQSYIWHRAEITGRTTSHTGVVKWRRSYYCRKQRKEPLVFDFSILSFICEILILLFSTQFQNTFGPTPSSYLMRLHKCLWCQY